MQAWIWIATGLVSGWLAGYLMKGRDYGIAGNLILGLIGSLVGGWVMHLLGFDSPDQWLQHGIVSLLGAMLVLGIARRLKPVSRQTRKVLGEVGALADLEAQFRKLGDFERGAISRFLRHDHKHQDPNAAFEEQMTFGQRVADRVATFGGSWTFIGLFLLFMLLWMAFNTELGARFDPYPFILLNLVLSCMAALQAPVIMMSQNRQTLRDRLDAKLDYEVNVRAELEIARLHAKVDQRDQAIEELIEINRRQLSLLERLCEPGPAQA